MDFFKIKVWNTAIFKDAKLLSYAWAGKVELWNTVFSTQQIFDLKNNKIRFIS